MCVNLIEQTALHFLRPSISRAFNADQTPRHFYRQTDKEIVNGIKERNEMAWLRKIGNCLHFVYSYTFLVLKVFFS